MNTRSKFNARCQTGVSLRLMSVIALGVCLSVTAVHAGTVSVNGSFEAQLGSITPDTSNPSFGESFASLTGWTLAGTGTPSLANGDFGPTDGPPYFAGNGSTIPYQFPTDGGTFVTFDSDNFTLSQVISVSGAGRAAVSFDLNNLSAVAGGAATAQVELFDGNSAASPSLYNSGVINILGLAQETWTSFASGVLQNTSTQMFLRLTLIDSTTGGLGAIDNVLVDHVVPEPSTALLISLGSIALLIRRRQR